MCRLFCTDVLVAAGFRVFSAATGHEGLELIRELEPALVVLDQHLPDLTGAGFLTALAHSRPAEYVPCKFIAMTADVSKPNDKKGKNSLLAKVLYKPFSANHLVQAVREVLEWPCPGFEDGLRHAQQLSPQLSVSEPLNAGLRTRFLLDLEEELKKLDQAVFRLDWQKARFRLHRLSGAAALAGFGTFSRCCRKFISSLDLGGNAASVAAHYLDLLNLSENMENESGS